MVSVVEALARKQFESAKQTWEPEKGLSIDYVLSSPKGSLSASMLAWEGVNDRQYEGACQ